MPLQDQDPKYPYIFSYSQPNSPSVRICCGQHFALSTHIHIHPTIVVG